MVGSLRDRCIPPPPSLSLGSSYSQQQQQSAPHSRPGVKGSSLRSPLSLQLTPVSIGSDVSLERRLLDDLQHATTPVTSSPSQGHAAVASPTVSERNCRHVTMLSTSAVSSSSSTSSVCTTTTTTTTSIATVQRGVDSSAHVHPQHASRRSTATKRATAGERTSSPSRAHSKVSRYPAIFVDLSNCRYPVIRHVFSDMLGFEVIQFNTVSTSSAATDVLPGCRVYWSDRSLAPLRVHKIVASKCIANHFPGIELLCRKISMGKLLMAMRSEFPSIFNFFPKTYLSHQELIAATTTDGVPHKVENGAVTSSFAPDGHSGGVDDEKGMSCDMGDGQEDHDAPIKPRPFYICKPNGGCCGRDIVITDRVTPWHFDGVVRIPRKNGEEWDQQGVGVADPCVVQEYISRPLLFGKRKCDLRCYVLIACVDPLVIYFYDEGIVRLCASEYHPPNGENVTSLSMHLANYAVNKKFKQPLPPHQQKGSPPNSDDSDSETAEQRTHSPKVKAAESATIPEEHASSLKQSFHAYRRYLLDYVQRQEHLMQQASVDYQARYGRHCTAIPYVLLASFLVDRLWEKIHDVVVMSIVSAIRAIRKAAPPNSLNAFSAGSSSDDGAAGCNTSNNNNRSSSNRTTSASNSGTRRSSSSSHRAPSQGSPLIQPGFGKSPASFYRSVFTRQATSVPASAGGGAQTSSDAIASSVLNQLVSKSPFFELLGFDILVDEMLKPWLIEINHSPSWTTDSSFDFELKRRVLRDALRLVLVPKVSKFEDASNVNDDHGDAVCSNSDSCPCGTPSYMQQKGLPSGASRRQSSAGVVALQQACEAKRSMWRKSDDEYEAEGNRFKLVFPSPRLLEEYEDVLKHQGVV